MFCFKSDDLGGAYEFKGVADSFVEIPNDGKMDTKNSMTILANIYPRGSGGPILNYKTDGWGVHLWQFESTELFVRFVHRNGVFHKPIASRVLQVCAWESDRALNKEVNGLGLRHMKNVGWGKRRYRSSVVFCRLNTRPVHGCLEPFQFATWTCTSINLFVLRKHKVTDDSMG